MKKRFTIMLDEQTIGLIKKYRSMCSPIGFREELEAELAAWSEWQIEHWGPNHHPWFFGDRQFGPLENVLYAEIKEANKDEDK